jgi:hypothetical protein
MTALQGWPPHRAWTSTCFSVVSGLTSLAITTFALTAASRLVVAHDAASGDARVDFALLEHNKNIKYTTMGNGRFVRRNRSMESQ